ncbi:MAG: SGNH/GDSL hydrolase family protein [Bacteroidales bacterium]|nr:SGNH/GDSL hydrolase family protein [Bacteroidales bacterium]
MTQKLFFLILFLEGCLLKVSSQQPIIIGHTSTDLNMVPLEYVNEAKSTMKVWYGHTSHGSQITSGIDNLQNHIGEPYTFNPEGSGGALSYQERTDVDLGSNGDTSWAQITRQVLNDPANDRNVIVWSWCGGVSTNTVDGINVYLTKMSELETNYPDVKFVYMTGHLDIWSYSTLKARNQQIRDYCNSNNKILFDFADIESYNPDAQFFDFATDNCDYYSDPSGTQLLGNWADEWCSAYPSSDLCWSCYCAHSKSLNCNLKGRAFWWLMARMAGWEGPLGVQETPLQNGRLNCWFSNECIYISLNLPSESVISIRLFDVTGKEVSEIAEKFILEKQQIVIPGTSLQKGFYLILLSDNHNSCFAGEFLVN